MRCDHVSIRKPMDKERGGDSFGGHITKRACCLSDGPGGGTGSIELSVSVCIQPDRVREGKDEAAGHGQCRIVLGGPGHQDVPGISFRRQGEIDAHFLVDTDAWCHFPGTRPVEPQASGMPCPPIECMGIAGLFAKRMEAVSFQGLSYV